MQKFSVLFLSNLIVFFTLAVEPNLPKSNSANQKKTESKKESFSQEQNNAELWPSKKPVYDVARIKELEAVFNSSPIDAQYIVKHLKNPKFYPNSASYRFATFVGPTGTGKTTMAHAIAYKMEKEAGWNSEFIEIGELIGDKRNQAVVRLKSKLLPIISKKGRTLVIIDEINELLEHSDDEHYDTAATSKFLWQFLDSQSGNYNFFMIGLMNRDTELPQQIKSRTLGRRIEFQKCHENEMCLRFRNKFFWSKMQLDKTIDDEFIKIILKKLGDCSGRDFTELIFLIQKIVIRHNQNSAMNVTKEILEEAIDEFLRMKINNKYENINESKNERDERHLAERFFIESIIRKCSVTHYSYDVGRVSSTWQTMSEECEAALADALNPSQKAIIKTMSENFEKAKDLKKAEIKEREEKERKARTKCLGPLCMTF